MDSRRTAKHSVIPALAALACVGCKELPGQIDACVPRDVAVTATRGEWRVAPPVPMERFGASALTAGGRIYYIGGVTGVRGDPGSARDIDRVDVYDPASDRWTPGPALPADAPRHHLAAAVNDGRIYVLGGYTGTDGGDPARPLRPNARAYVLEANAWRRLADQPVARGAATAQAIRGRIYVAGGGDGQARALDDLAVYDPSTDRWVTGAQMPTPREHLASCDLNGRLVVVGGWFSVARQTLDAAQSYDPSSDTWTLLRDMPTHRGALGAVALGGVCYVVGGERWHGDEPDTFAVMEGYDETRGFWLAMPPMPTARHGAGVTALDGQIYVVGGGPTRGHSYSSAVEAFTP